MRVYIISGNRDILNEVERRLLPNNHIVDNQSDFANDESAMYFGDDYSLLKFLYDSNNDIKSCVISIHDSEHPVDMGSDKTGWFFNEFRDAKPTEFMCDKFIDISTRPFINKDKTDVDMDAVVNATKDCIDMFFAFEKIGNDIRDGKTNIRFDKWSFSGGRDEDCWEFSLLKNDEALGYVRLYPLKRYVSVNYDNVCCDNCGWNTRVNEQVFDFYDIVVREALKRDDAEYSSKSVDEHGNVILPEDMDDISREDILSGEYNVSEGTWQSLIDEVNKFNKSADDGEHFVEDFGLQNELSANHDGLG